jgi:hypothetical protein
MGNGEHFLAAYRPRCETDHSPSCDIEGMNLLPQILSWHAERQIYFTFKVIVYKL